MSDGHELVEHLRRLSVRRKTPDRKSLGRKALGDRPYPPASILGLVGSSRNNGNTHKLAALVFRRLKNANLVDITRLSIAPYDYNQAYDDDFPLIADAIDQAQVIVFASPLYWYSMSGQMKILIDRLTDLTESYKEIGRRLAGKRSFLIGSGGNPTAPSSFEFPFAQTADYFDMTWGGMLYEPMSDPSKAQPGLKDRAAAFAARIMDSAPISTETPANGQINPRQYP